MNELSQRLQQAVRFLRNNGYAKSDSEISRKLGVSASWLNMAVNGSRIPSLELLVSISDAYPVSFEWLRTGRGSMVKEERELMLLRRIEELEKEIAELKK